MNAASVSRSFVVNVRCEPERHNNIPDYAIVEIDRVLADQILALAEAAEQLGVYEITQLACMPRFWPETTAMLDLPKSDDERRDADCETLMVVTSTSVKWRTGSGQGAVRFETDAVSLSDLVAAFRNESAAA